MNKTIIIIIAAVIIIGGGIFAFTMKKDKTDVTSTTPTPSPSTSSDTDMSTTPISDSPAPATPAAATNTVTIDNFAFSPANITVKKGATVTWTNKDSATHTVTETDEQKGPDSGNMATGKTYSFTYDTIGTFKYKCAIHPSMVGTVTVTE